MTAFGILMCTAVLFLTMSRGSHGVVHAFCARWFARSRVLRRASGPCAWPLGLPRSRLPSDDLTCCARVRGDVATCVANAADGATINIATGTHAWSTEVTVQNKRVTIVGAGEALTTLDRNRRGRFFTVGDGGHVTLKHLTVTKGSAVSPAA